MDLNLIFGLKGGEAGKVVDVPKSLLSPEQLSLFNGFDEIGGDTTKFDDAVEWYTSTMYKNEATALCIVVLDKPTSYVFGGMNKSELNEFTTAVRKLQEYSREIRDSEVTATGKLMKLAAIRNTVESCTVLGYEDGRLVYTGENKTCLSQTLLRSMPLYTDSEIESFTDVQLEKMKASRMFWEGNFPLVNVSRMKRLAMIYMELTKNRNLIKQAAKWINKHGGIPSRANKFGNNEDTMKILQEDIKNLIDNKELWKKHKEVFKKAMTKDNLEIENEHILTSKQKEFVQKMGGGGDFIGSVLNKIAYEDELNVNTGLDSSALTGGVNTNESDVGMTKDGNRNLPESSEVGVDHVTDDV